MNVVQVNDEILVENFRNSKFFSEQSRCDVVNYRE
jgi:hypothetical protein